MRGGERHPGGYGGPPREAQDEFRRSTGRIRQPSDWSTEHPAIQWARPPPPTTSEASGGSGVGEGESVAVDPARSVVGETVTVRCRSRHRSMNHRRSSTGVGVPEDVEASEAGNV